MYTNMHIWRMNPIGSQTYGTVLHSVPPLKSPCGARRDSLVTTTPRGQTVAWCQGDGKAPNLSQPHAERQTGMTHTHRVLCP